jgi:hypothetical protein
MVESKYLTAAELIRSAEGVRREFNDDYVPLTETQRSVIKRFTDVVTAAPKDVSRNIIKKRSQLKIKEIWNKNKVLFVVVSLSALYPTKLGSRTSTDYLVQLDRWWRKVPHPKGLTESIADIADILPPGPVEDTQLVAVLKRDDLVDFLQKHPGAEGSYTITIFGERHKHSRIEISDEMTQDLILHTLERTSMKMALNHVEL